MAYVLCVSQLSQQSNAYWSIYTLFHFQNDIICMHSNKLLFKYHSYKRIGKEPKMRVAIGNFLVLS